MANSAVLLATPPALICSIWLPGASPAGTVRFTWYNPTNVGANPEKDTCAGTPPMVTAGVLVVSAYGPVEGAATPGAMAMFTGPNPVAYIASVSPGTAGL